MLLPIFYSGVPVHIEGVPVHFAHCHFFAQVYRYTLRVYRYTLPTSAFLALLEFLKLHQSFAHILDDSYLLPGHKSLYIYALNLKDLHKSKNTKEIKSTYPLPDLGKVCFVCAKFYYNYCSIVYSSMIGLQKSSIVSVIGGLLATVLCSSVWTCLSSSISAFSALLVFLKLLSVLSNSVSARNRSKSYFLCIKGFPEIKTHSD